jgi:diguanylate cyclase (GGDEF)-like protein
MDSLGSWSTHRLTEFLAVVSACDDEEIAMRIGIERAAESLEAEVAALTDGSRVLAAVGFPPGACPERELLMAARGEATTLVVPGVGPACVATVPMEGSGGALLLARGGPDAFSNEELDLVRGMGRVLTLTLRLMRVLGGERALRERSEREVGERKEAERELAYQAVHDALTGLPNRSLLFDRLGHALARGQRDGSGVAVLFVDLDDFKRVNDSLGHSAGDELLIAVGARFQDALRGADTLARPVSETVARFGGDEFVILCEGLANEHDATQIAERIGAALRQPFVLGSEELFVTASAGVAVAFGSAATAESLIRDADTAMYAAKGRGGSRYELFDDAMRARVVDRLRREKELRLAIERDELRLVYQPIVALADQRILGIEALVRWDHPERGPIAPADFIPLAEETGLIVPIGRWVLEAACRQAAEWERRQPEGCPWVSVNLSACQLADAELPQAIARALEDTGVDPRLIALEITETVLMDETEYPVELLEALRELGVRIFLDDFGTGYSSLSYIKRLPLDVLKLDQSFVAGLESDGGSEDRIVAAVIDMTRALGVDLVVEGVETEAQYSYLRKLGCRFAQGYYFARPTSATEISGLLDARAAGEWLIRDAVLGVAVA